MSDIKRPWPDRDQEVACLSGLVSPWSMPRLTPVIPAASGPLVPSAEALRWPATTTAPPFKQFAACAGRLACHLPLLQPWRRRVPFSANSRAFEDSLETRCLEQCPQPHTHHSSNSTTLDRQIAKSPGVGPSPERRNMPTVHAMRIPDTFPDSSSR